MTTVIVIAIYLGLLLGLALFSKTLFRGNFEGLLCRQSFHWPLHAPYVGLWNHHDCVCPCRLNRESL
jgi:hypothetical protein